MTLLAEPATPPATSRLTDAQRADLERDGFLLLPGVLTPEQVAHFTAVVDRLDADFRAEKSMDGYGTVEIRNAIARPGGDGLLPLLDWPATFPLVADIFGWNIQLTTSHVFVRTPNPSEPPTFKAIDWHADGPNPQFPTLGGVFPRLYGKIGFFLTDLSEPDHGNLRVVPGSHKSAKRPENDPETGEPKGAIQVMTKPGDAVFFEQRTWHAVGPNYSTLPRKNVYIGYCYRWMKAIDFVTQPAELLDKANPIQRQLLGAATHELSFYLPSRNDFADTPLKALLEG